MKRTLYLLAILLLAASAVLAYITNRDVEQEGELVKVLRDPNRVDKRWLFVTGMATAGVCFGLWANSGRKIN